MSLSSSTAYSSSTQIRVFDGRSMGRHGSNVSSSVKLRLIDYADVQTDWNPRCTHMPICTLCWMTGKISFYALREFPWFPRFG